MKLPWAGRLASAWDAVRSSYWFVPGTMAVLAAAAAAGTLELDARTRAGTFGDWPLVSDMGVEGARAVLSVVAGSLITVTGVVFSITVVALTLAASQFGPRLLRHFMRDTSNQLVLGTFVATFLFNLLVLWSINEEGEPPYAPRLATSMGVALGVISLFVLIYFIHHAARSLQASSIIASVGSEIDDALGSLFPDELGHGRRAGREPDEALRARLRREGMPVCASSVGYVRVVDEEGLLSVACDADLVIGLAHRPGDFVAGSGTLAWVVGEGADAERVKAVRECFVLGAQRTPVQDLSFLTRQLTEMAVRALSPGVNDPFTAVACVHRLGAALARLADRAMPDALRYDEHDVLRTVVLDPIDFGTLVESMFGPIRRYGAKDADVMVAVLGAIAGAAARTDAPERLRALRAFAQELRGESLRNLQVESERRRLEHAFTQVTAT